MDFMALELELQTQTESIERKIPVERRMVTQMAPLSSPSIHAAMIEEENSLCAKIDEACDSFAANKKWPDLTPQVRELVFVRLLSLRASIYSPGQKTELTRLFAQEASLFPQGWLGRLLREQWHAGGRDRWRAQKAAFEDATPPDLPPEFFSQRQ